MNRKATIIIFLQAALIVVLFWFLIFFGKDEYEAATTEGEEGIVTKSLFLENKAFDFVIDENNDIEINDKPVIRRPRTVIPDTNIIQLCEINLGYWRKYYDKKFDILFGKRVETPAADGKIIYTTIISCTP